MATEIKLRLGGLVVGYDAIRKVLKRQKRRQEWESRARDVNTERGLAAGVGEIFSLALLAMEMEGKD